MNKQKGITMIALTITIIILILLATVVVSTFNEGNIIENAEKAVDIGNVEKIQEKIQLAIVRKTVFSDKRITIEQILEELEKQGIINSGDGNSKTGQVKTQPYGYIYEIKENANGEWEITYIGKGEVTLPELLIQLSKNATGITNSVTITMTAKAESGIRSYTLPQGTEQSVANGTKEITKTYTATENGTYVFTVTNGNGKTESKSITINNIVEGIIAISSSPTTPTKENVTVTVTWPSDTTGCEKKISKDNGVTWEDYTTSVTITENCTVKARLIDSVGEIVRTATCTINNIDKTNPTVTAKTATVTITEGDSHSLGEYFTVVANGTYGISSTKYVDTSNGNAEVSNTNTLAVGTHVIKCTATKETGASASASVTIVVEQLVSPPEEPTEPAEGTNIIAIENIKITTDEAGTTVPVDNSLSLNTPVYITFDAIIDGGKINTITPSLPYQTNGTEMNVKFTVTGEKDGKTITEEKRVIFTDKYTVNAKISNVSGKNPLQYALHYRVTEGEAADKFNVWGNTNVEEGKTCKCEQAKTIFDKAKEEGRVVIYDNLSVSGRYANITEPSLVYYEYKCLNSEQKPGGKIPMPYSLDYECNFNGREWVSIVKPDFNKRGGDIEDALVWLDEEYTKLGWTCFYVRSRMYPSVPLNELEQKYHFSIQVLTKTDFLKTAKEMGIDVSGYNCLIEL